MATLILLAALAAGLTPDAGGPSKQPPPVNDQVEAPPPVPRARPVMPTPEAVTLPLQPAAAAPAPAPPAPPPPPAPTATRKVVRYEYEEPVTVPLQPAAAAPAPAPPAVAGPATTYTGVVQQPGLLGRVTGRVGRCLAKHGDPWVRLAQAGPQTAAVTLVSPAPAPAQPVVERWIYPPTPPVASVQASPQTAAVMASPQSLVYPRKGGWFSRW